MRNTRYVQVACPVCGAMVRIMGDHSVPELCPDCRMPLSEGIREASMTAAAADPGSEGFSGPRSAMVRLFAIRH
jgi:hypothetical protein